MEKLGIEVSLIAFQIVNFGILMFVLKKVLYKPVVNALKAREENLALAEKRENEAKEKLEGADAKAKKILNEAEQEKRSILDNAGKVALAKEKELIEKAENRAKEIVRKANEEVQRQLKASEKVAEKRAVEIAMALTKKVLTDALNGKAQKDLVDSAVKKIAKVKA